MIQYLVKNQVDRIQCNYLSLHSISKDWIK